MHPPATMALGKRQKGRLPKGVLSRSQGSRRYIQVFLEFSSIPSGTFK